MNELSWVIARLSEYSDKTAIIHHGKKVSYPDLIKLIELWLVILAQSDIRKGDIVALIGDYSAHSCALLFALLINHNTVVPLASCSITNREKFLKISEAEFSIELHDDGQYTIAKQNNNVNHTILQDLKVQHHAGLILFSSGSTGHSKAMVLDVNKLMNKFKAKRKSYTTILFLLMDHIGGINTLLHVLTQGGTLVTLHDRNPATICKAIADYQVELLPTTPTFLNMMLISGIYQDYNLSSLKLITYGTEPMPKSTLTMLNQLFPAIKFKQTYGLSETGILPTKSLDDNSQWFVLGNETVKYKIEDGLLHIYSDTAMLGYLNAPNPFTDDGWLNTGDMVEVKHYDGVEYIRVLGRKTEIINVGGEKVYPQEVENILLQIPNIVDALVTGKKNPVTGNIVIAKIKCEQPEDPYSLHMKIKNFCKDKIENYKVPVFIEIVAEDLYGDRFKKSRFANANH